MRKIIILLCLVCTGCSSTKNMSSTGPIKHIDPPPNSTVIGYETLKVFRGFEFTIALPGAEVLPVVGPIIAEGIGIKAGLTDTVIAPKMEGKNCVIRYIPKYPLPPLHKR